MENIYNEQVLFDVVKSTAKGCLKNYDSYYISMYNSHTSNNRHDYIIYCGDIKDNGGSPFFTNYKEYRFYFNSGTTSTFDIKSSFKENNNSLTLTKNMNSVHSALNFSNIKSLDLPDIVAIEEQITSSSPEVSLPFEREEFIAIPFLLCLLIVMLFLKWCFPMKGGKSI